MKNKGITIGVSVLCVAALATGTAFAAGGHGSPRTAAPDAYEPSAVQVGSEASETQPDVQFDFPALKEVHSGAMGLLRGFTCFYGDYFEENKDKTLSELREAWESSVPESKVFEFRTEDGDVTAPEGKVFHFRDENGDTFSSESNIFEFRSEISKGSVMITGTAGILFSDDFYEANKDKTLAEAKEVWLGEVKDYIEQAVTDETLTRETADAILAALESGDLSAIMEAAAGAMPRFEISFGMEPAMGGMFSGDYYEENKDKTLRELRDEWLSEYKTKLDEAVASGTITQEQADEAYENAEQGKVGSGFGFSRRGGFKGGNDAPSFEKSFGTQENTATATANKL